MAQPALRFPAFAKDAQVKLSDRYARALMKAKGKSANWLGRVGIVTHCGRDSVAILWEGRTSRDWVPIKAVELINQGSSQ